MVGSRPYLVELEQCLTPNQLVILFALCTHSSLMEVFFKVAFDFFFDLLGGLFVLPKGHMFQFFIGGFQPVVAYLGHQGDERQEMRGLPVLHVEEGLPQVVYFVGGVFHLAMLDKFAYPCQVIVEGIHRLTESCIYHQHFVILLEAHYRQFVDVIVHRHLVLA